MPGHIHDHEMKEHHMPTMSDKDAQQMNKLIAQIGSGVEDTLARVKALEGRPSHAQARDGRECPGRQ